MIDIEHIPESDIEYKEEVIRLTKEASAYLNAFKWCKGIKKGWVAKEFGYILAILLFEIEPENADASLWVIVGDIPSAYIDVVGAPTAYAALSCYCDLMQDWADHVSKGQSTEYCYPVAAAPTKEHAGMLLSRIELIRSDYLPWCID